MSDTETDVIPDSEVEEAADTVAEPTPAELNARLLRMEATLDSLREGVNTIGEMMNQVATVFDDLADKVKSGGIGALIGGFMGGNKNG